MKSKYAEPCTHCGACCRASLCPAAEVAFPDASPPCPGIYERDSRVYCGLVLMEKIGRELDETVEPLVQKMLGIGCGCSYPDEETTEAEVILFDLKCKETLKKREVTP